MQEGLKMHRPFRFLPLRKPPNRDWAFIDVENTCGARVQNFDEAGGVWRSKEACPCPCQRPTPFAGRSLVKAVAPGLSCTPPIRTQDRRFREASVGFRKECCRCREKRRPTTGPEDEGMKKGRLVDLPLACARPLANS